MSRAEHRRIAVQLGQPFPDAWDLCACGHEKPKSFLRCAQCARYRAMATGITFREAVTGLKPGADIMDKYLDECRAAMDQQGTRHESYTVIVRGFNPAQGGEQRAWVVVGTIDHAVAMIRQTHGWEHFIPTQITLTAPENIFQGIVVG